MNKCTCDVVCKMSATLLVVNAFDCLNLGLSLTLNIYTIPPNLYTGWLKQRIIIDWSVNILKIHNCFVWRQKVYFIHVYGQKNLKRHTTHAIVSWPNPKQWLMIHIFLLVMIILWRTGILLIINRVQNKLSHISYDLMKCVFWLFIHYIFADFLRLLFFIFITRVMNDGKLPWCNVYFKHMNYSGENSGMFL